MKSNYKPLGRFIKEINLKNKDLKENNLLGVSISKKFIPSIANTHGTNFKNYKVIKYNQFAYGPVTSRNGDKISIALLKEKSGIISSSYKVFSIIDEEILCPDYLMLWFEREEFDRYARFKSHGSVREIFSWEELCNTLIPIPDIEIQHKIVKIDKIIKNRIQIKENTDKNLNYTIKNIYKNWFENFKPFKNEKFYDTELGKIPRGWNVKSLKDFIKFQEGPGIRNWQYVYKDGIKFLNIRCIQNNDINLDTANMISKEEANGKYSHFLLNEWDIVISSSGTLGRYAIIRKEHLPLCLNTSIIRFSPMHSSDHYSFIYSYLTSETFYNHLITMSSGSAQLNFGPTHLKQIILVVPPEKILKEYHDLIFPLLKKMNSVKSEINQLIILREALLPKLMNGEINVHNVDF